MTDKIDILLAGAAVEERRYRAEALRAQSGVRVAEVGSGREVVSALRRGKYQTLICSEQLDIKACILTRMIRAGVCGYPSLPVITITASTAVQPITHHDAASFVISDLPPDEFAAQVFEILEARPKPAVLLVEDDPVVAEFASAVLAPYYSVEVAFGGAEALRAWRVHRHELILLDLMLPGSLSGEQVLGQIVREDPEQSIIIVTAASDTEKFPDTVLAGAAAYLKKPIDPAALTRTIDTVLREREWHLLAMHTRRLEDQIRLVSARVHAANYALTRGQTAQATQHLERALTQCAAQRPSEDEWAQLVTEFLPPPYTE